MNSNPGAHGNVVPPAGPLFIRVLKKGEDQGREGERRPMVDLGTASCG